MVSVGYKPLYKSFIICCDFLLIVDFIILTSQLFQFIITNKERVDQINLKIDFITKNIITHKLYHDMDLVLTLEDLPEEVSVSRFTSFLVLNLLFMSFGERYDIKMIVYIH